MLKERLNNYLSRKSRTGVRLISTCFPQLRTLKMCRIRKFTSLAHNQFYTLLFVTKWRKVFILKPISSILWDCWVAQKLIFVHYMLMAIGQSVLHVRGMMTVLNCYSFSIKCNWNIIYLNLYTYGNRQGHSQDYLFQWSGIVVLKVFNINSE